MNLDLLDPFQLAQDIPEVDAGLIRLGMTTCIRFNRQGDMLATGRLHGTILIVDVETNGIARKLKGHARQIQSLSWSSSGRYLLSCSAEWRCILWDLQDGSRVATVKFNGPVWIAELHPKNHLLFVSAVMEDDPVLVDLRHDVPKRTKLPSAPKTYRDGDEDELSDKDRQQATTVVTFTASGDHILAGTHKGWLNIISTATATVIHSTSLTSKVILLIRVTPNGRSILINAKDGVIRTLNLPDLSDPTLDLGGIHLEVEHRFQDVVNKLQWNWVTFSSSGDYVAASASKNNEVYMWERAHGSLVKILEGREEYNTVDWHPTRPLLAAVGHTNGTIQFWGIPTPQRWSALAPDFVEVEENEEYVEREDEFDIKPDEEMIKRRMEAEDEVVDVLTVDMGNGGTAGSNAKQATTATTTTANEEPPFRMPLIIGLEASDDDEEVLQVGAGQYRRKSPGEVGAAAASAGGFVAGDRDTPASGDEVAHAANGGGRSASNGSTRRGGTGGGRGTKRRRAMD